MSRLYLSTIFRSVIEFRGRTLLYVLVHPRLTVRQRWGLKPFAPSVPVYSFSFPSACNCFGKVCQCTVHSARLLWIWRAKQRRWKREPRNGNIMVLGALEVGIPVSKLSQELVPESCLASFFLYTTPVVSQHFQINTELHMLHP